MPTTLGFTLDRQENRRVTRWIGTQYARSGMPHQESHRCMGV
jgi:hypothetical protein